MTIFTNDCFDCFRKPVLKNKRWAKVEEVTFIVFFKAYSHIHRDHKNRQGESCHLFPASYNTSNKSLGILTIAFFISQGIRKIKLNAQQPLLTPQPPSSSAVNASQVSRSTSWEVGFISLGALSSHSTSSMMPTQVAPSKAASLTPLLHEYGSPVSTTLITARNDHLYSWVTRPLFIVRL